MSNTISAQGWSLNSTYSVATSYLSAVVGTVPNISGKVEKVELKIPLSAGQDANSYNDNMYPLYSYAVLKKISN